MGDRKKKAENLAKNLKGEGIGRRPQKQHLFLTLFLHLFYSPIEQFNKQIPKLRATASN